MMSFARDIRTSRYLQLASLFFVLGCAMHIYLALRSWIGGDQIYLLSLGLDFSVRDQVQPFAKMMSGAGANPGILQQLLIGIPLKLLPHFQSPMIGVILFHICGGVLFVSVIRSCWGDRAAFLAVIAYWLSPWRLYNAGFLWEPSFIFLPAAAHLWSCYKMNNTPHSGAAFVLGLALTSAIQIHNSSFVLLLVTLALLVRKDIKLRWLPFLAGAGLGSLTLIPSLLAVLQGSIPPARESQGYIGWSLLHGYPALKGIVYWFTLGGMDMVRQLNETRFLSEAFRMQYGEINGAGIFVRLLQVLCVLTVFVSVRASWIWFWRNRNDTRCKPSELWLKRYALASAGSLLIAAALSPIVLQGWQVVIMLHSAVLPMIIWAERDWLGETPRPGRWHWVASYVVLQLLVLFVISQGSYIFSNPGELPDAVRNNLELVKIIPPR